MTNAVLNADLNTRFAQVLADLGWRTSVLTTVFDTEYASEKGEMVLSHLYLDGLVDSGVLLFLHAQERLNATGSDRVKMLQMEHCSNKLFPVAETFCGADVVVEKNNAFGEEFDPESITIGVYGYVSGIDDPFEEDVEEAFSLGGDALYCPEMNQDQWRDWYTYWVEFAHRQVQYAVDAMKEASRPILSAGKHQG